MSDDHDDLIGESFTWVNFKFKTIRMTDNVFTSHTSTVKAEMIQDDELTATEVTVAMEKLHFWFDHIMPLSILFSRTNPHAVDLMFDDEGNIRTSNLPMILPDDPADDVLALVLHSKMNALVGDKIAFGLIEIQSDTKEKLTFTFTGCGEFVLPNMGEWIGERAYHTKPWWARDDGSTLDVVPPDDGPLDDKPFVGIDLSFIEERLNPNKNKGAVVVRPSKFVPEVILGGKDDKPKS